VKKIHLIVLLVALGGGILRAQTNAVAAPKPSRGPTMITSHRADFSDAARQIIYTGNVRVDDPQMTLTCEQLIADLPPNGGHIQHIVAVTNVVIDSVDEKGQTNHATSDKAIYDYNVQNGVTNEIITLTGNAKVENAKGTQTGEPMWWNRANNSFHADNYHMISAQHIGDVMGSTNSSAKKTNSPPGTVQHNDIF
jgi:lipopolysaccharide transport protein LptA